MFRHSKLSASLLLAMTLFSNLPVTYSAVPAVNPFSVKSFYVNPSYQKELDTSIATASGTIRYTLSKMREVPSAYWIDVKEKINGEVKSILSDAAGKSQLVVLIV